MVKIRENNKSAIIEIAIEQKLDAGIRNKHQIFSEVVDELGVPRPIVRRIARDLRSKYLNKVRILQSEITTSDEKSL